MDRGQLMQINPSALWGSKRNLQSRDTSAAPATEDIRHATPAGNSPSEPLSERGPRSSRARAQFSAFSVNGRRRGEAKRGAGSESRSSGDASGIEPYRPNIALSCPDRDSNAAIVGRQRAGCRDGLQSGCRSRRSRQRRPATRYAGKPELRFAATRVSASGRARSSRRPATQAQRRPV